MKLLVLLSIFAVCCSIPFACIQVEAKEQDWKSTGI